MIEHNFTESDRRAAKHQSADWYLKIISMIWPGSTITPIAGKDPRNAKGVDVIVETPSGRKITIDNKFRAGLWSDFALEYISDEARQTKGWMEKELICDYIGYWFVAIEKGYLISHPSLMPVWQKHRDTWIASKKIIKAENRDGARKWTTLSVAIPIQTLCRLVDIIPIGDHQLLVSEARRRGKTFEYISGEWP